jgi:O-antigen ligase
MAPPRMLPGFVDTLAMTANAGWWGDDASAPRGLGELTNQLAAMPSLHVGWAVWVAWVVVRLTKRRWLRVLGVAYPVMTTLVVVATANHYLLDAVAGAAVVALAVRLSRRTARWGRAAAVLPAAVAAATAPATLEDSPAT